MNITGIFPRKLPSILICLIYFNFVRYAIAQFISNNCSRFQCKKCNNFQKLPNNYSLSVQCCWSGSAIRCFFAPGPGSGISFLRISDRGSPTNVSKSFVTTFWVANTQVLCQLAQIFLLHRHLFKNKIILDFVSLFGYKVPTHKDKTTNFFPPSLFYCCWIRDPEWNPGSRYLGILP
jgi:hypothetical protein